MNRRNFLKNAFYSSLAMGSSFPTHALANVSCTPLPTMPRTLVNLMLYGGADLRFLLMPEPQHDSATAYVNKIWTARRKLYPSYRSYQKMFDNEYLLTTDINSGFQFGIHKSAGWLKAEFDAHRVAIIANTFCSRNRRHDQSQLNTNVGEPEYDQLIYDRDGWGGRLIEQLSGTANLVELSNEISIFGQGSIVGSRLQRIVHAQDTRNISLPNIDYHNSIRSKRNVLIRALKSYYEARMPEVIAEQPADWPHHLFFQHNKAFRDVGDKVNSRLTQCGALPSELSDLILHSRRFQQQCCNLFDMCLTPDILSTRVVSMRHNQWDTHNNQYERITHNLADLFGVDGGLATAFTQINLLENKPLDNLVCATSTDFGRQLVANGNSGTDHGRGVYTLMMGQAINGGLYGEMFPERESTGAVGESPLEMSGADIEGLTSTERVFAEVCEWMKTGSSHVVFPHATSAVIETEGLLDNLFV